MESQVVKKLRKKLMDWSRYKFGVVVFQDGDHYKKNMRDKWSTDEGYRKRRDSYSTSVEDRNMFDYRTVSITSIFQEKNFYPAIIVVADTDRFGSFWINPKEFKELNKHPNVDGGGYFGIDKAGREILDTTNHYPNGNCLGYFRRDSYKYQHITIWVPKEIVGKEAIINYFKTEIEASSSFDNKCVRNFNPNASFLCGKFSNDRIEFFEEVQIYSHYVNKLWGYLCEFNK